MNELKTLEILKILKDFVLENNKNGLDRSFINGAFNIIEKKLKAFDIIKQNRMFYLHDDMPQGTYRIYDCELYSYYDLTKEEYDLLKEVL